MESKENKFLDAISFKAIFDDACNARITDLSTTKGFIVDDVEYCVEVYGCLFNGISELVIYPVIDDITIDIDMKLILLLANIELGKYLEANKETIELLSAELKTKEELLILKSAIKELKKNIKYINHEMVGDLYTLSEIVLNIRQEDIFKNHINIDNCLWNKGEIEIVKQWLKQELKIVNKKLRKYERISNKSKS